MGEVDLAEDLKLGRRVALTFTWLEKAFQSRSFFLTGLRLEPLLDAMRSDSRGTDLLRRVSLPWHRAECLARLRN